MTDDEVEKLASEMQAAMNLDDQALKAVFEKDGEPRLAGKVIPERKLAEVAAFFGVPRDRLNLLPGQVVYVLSVQLDFLRDPNDASKFTTTLEEMLSDFAALKGILRIIKRRTAEEGGKSSFSA